MTAEDVGVRLSQAMEAISAEIPARLNVVGILRDAHERITKAALPDVLPPEVVTDKVTEVLREIATHAVEEFTRRTGQAFLWVDEPEPDAGDDVVMSFGIDVKDGKGHVTF